MSPDKKKKGREGGLCQAGETKEQILIKQAQSVWEDRWLLDCLQTELCEQNPSSSLEGKEDGLD